MEKENRPAGLSGALSRRVKTFRMARAASHVPAGSSVLDLGCGLGEILSLLPGDVTYVGVDSDPYMIRHNSRAFPGREFRLLDMASDPLPPGPWDAVLLLAVLEHLVDPAGLLERLRPLLHHGGRIIATTPRPAGRPLHAILSSLRLLSSYADHQHEAFLGRGDLETVAALSGLTLTLYRPFLCGLNQLAIFEATPSGP